MHLVPLSVVAEIAKVMHAGNQTHPNRVPDDWKTMPDFRNRLFSAALRHLAESQYGAAADPETGLSHISHALPNLAMLVWHEQNPQQRGAQCEDA